MAQPWTQPKVKSPNVFYYGLGLFGLPRRSGKIKDLTKFDARFFGVHPKQANVMDPQLRILLEVTYEALVDAGGHLLTYSVFC